MTPLAPSQRSRLAASVSNWRIAFLVLALGLGLWGMCSGVSLSERELGPFDWSLAEFGMRLYYALSLFGGVDLGVPSAGPVWASRGLWVAYFMAPMVTLSAVFEAALRLINSQDRRMRRLRDHVVVCGGGRLARLYIQRLRELDAHVSVVLIERDANKALLRELSEVYRVEILIGDIASDDVLAQARLARAQRVVLVTGDDFTNLDAAARIVRDTPGLRGRIITHVADLAFLHAIPQAVKDDGYETFNSLESAAIHLVEQRLIAVFAATEARDLVVLAGFGRFGQTVLQELESRAGDRFGTVIIIDIEAEAHSQHYADHAGFRGREHHVIEGHLRRPQVWHRVDALVREAAIQAPVFVVGTGDEGTNLQTALDLRQRYTDAHITVRSFAESPFASEVAERLDIEPLVLAELITASMPSRWFVDADELS